MNSKKISPKNIVKKKIVKGNDNQRFENGGIPANDFLKSLNESILKDERLGKVYKQTIIKKETYA